ncbi:hypothetical protein PILCRDRAFT_819549 [Piloderma croceum F 1598]|uniref:Mitochondrial import inner membrane translocase subunit TIM16 n=1 Tax=Piloderma croceum (strain F 1598) TaxID=765440 RepID=A0A0C3C141_PILCF|nr:hypothetical protein PILCRDRAFT_819549 [Piloderma croceum F 1598]
MSAPKIIVQLVVTGAQILGKAFYEAGKQAVKNAKQAPPGAITSDVAGVRNATSTSWTDKLTREHRMTLDEAHLILNTKKEEELERVLRNYEHLFKMNSPASPSSSSEPTPTPRPTAGKQPVLPSHSHYLQSKVVRARERIEAELKIAQEDAASPATHEAPGSAPPPPSEGGTGPGSKPS